MKFGITAVGLLGLWIAGPIGCARRPEFSDEIQQDVSQVHGTTIALDPRTDLIFGDGSQMCLDAASYQSRVIQELEAMGYRVVPADQAKLWVQVLALAERPRAARNRAGQAPAGGMRGRGMSGGPGSGPGGGPGGEPRGGPGGGPREGAHKQGDAMITLVVALLEPSTGEALWRARMKAKLGPFDHRPSDRGPGGPPSGPGDTPIPQGEAPHPNGDGKRPSEPLEELTTRLHRMLEPLRIAISAAR